MNNNSLIIPIEVCLLCKIVAMKIQWVVIAVEYQNPIQTILLLLSDIVELYLFVYVCVLVWYRVSASPPLAKYGEPPRRVHFNFFFCSPKSKVIFSGPSIELARSANKHHRQDKEKKKRKPSEIEWFVFFAKKNRSEKSKRKSAVNEFWRLVD